MKQIVTCLALVVALLAAPVNGWCQGRVLHMGHMAKHTPLCCVDGHQLAVKAPVMKTPAPVFAPAVYVTVAVWPLPHATAAGMVLHTGPPKGMPHARPFTGMRLRC